MAGKDMRNGKKNKVDLRKVGWTVVEVWEDFTQENGIRLKEVGSYRSEKYAKQVCYDLAWDHLGDKAYLRAVVRPPEQVDQ